MFYGKVCGNLCVECYVSGWSACNGVIACHVEGSGPAVFMRRVMLCLGGRQYLVHFIFLALSGQCTKEAVNPLPTKVTRSIVNGFSSGVGRLMNELQAFWKNPDPGVEINKVPMSIYHGCLKEKFTKVCPLRCNNSCKPLVCPLL